MRLDILLIPIFPSVTSFGQRHITGTYADPFSKTLQLNADSTFRANYDFDLMHYWIKGRWRAEGRSITLTFVPVYDTFKRVNQADTLVLSLDETQNQIDATELTAIALVSGGQNPEPFHYKLFLKGNRLYDVMENGKLRRGRHPSFWGVRTIFHTRKKWRVGYKKRR